MSYISAEEFLQNNRLSNQTSRRSGYISADDFLDELRSKAQGPVGGNVGETLAIGAAPPPINRTVPLSREEEERRQRHREMMEPILSLPSPSTTPLREMPGLRDLPVTPPQPEKRGFFKSISST